MIYHNHIIKSDEWFPHIDEEWGGWNFDNPVMSLEETRILLGHSPCYKRRGYTRSYDTREELLKYNIFDDRNPSLQNSLDVAVSMEDGLDDFLDTVNDRLLDDPEEFNKIISSKFKTLLGK